jgi:hypothetical protein
MVSARLGNGLAQPADSMKPPPKPAIFKRNQNPTQNPVEFARRIPNIPRA